MPQTKSQTDIIQDIYDQGTYMDPKPAVGKAIIRAILDSGMSPAAALWVYQAKHVRWFMDGHGGEPKTGKVAYAEFKKYIGRNANRVKDDVKMYVIEDEDENAEG
jgi:hypothetical protein